MVWTSRIAAWWDAVQEQPETLRRIRFRAAMVLVLSVATWVLAVPGFIDLHVYRTGGLAWRTGVGLYSPEFAQMVPGARLPFTYPPFAAILFAPVQLLQWHLSKFVISFVSAAALAVTTTLVARRLFARQAVADAVGMSAAALWVLSEPVRQTIWYGQINLILMGLVAADCLLPRTRWPRGLLVGVAAAIKLTPAVFVLLFLVRGRYRAAATALGSFAACGLVAWLLAPHDSVEYWTQTLFQTDRIGGAVYAYNQNIQAVLARLLPGSNLLWAVLAAAAMALAVVAARRARDEVTALLAIAAGGLLASPVSWSHHWVWVLPAALVLVVRAPRWSPVLVVFAVGPHALLPQTDNVEMRWTWWQHVLGSSYLLITVFVLVWLAVRPAPARPPYGGNSGSAPLVGSGGGRYRPSRSGDTGGPELAPEEDVTGPVR
ncbi:glycosyltransferase 87 family protein [Amycolatopsis granulosa]|uniref:glycosyltransferase 87 family protein n=1 Tax=Amycolatopsis granulosa TaxID=185684 RepID=UPI001421773C|nr:glycosyltransferase 87 family protein [Amycolatopsis granulosa]NIH84054.1 alpha-1,2-mannosyltransferase [Amycolatopsis granulosa]